MATWVSRDTNADSRGLYVFWSKRPMESNFGIFRGRGGYQFALVTLCASHVHRLTDLRLKPGQCVKLKGRIHFPVEDA